jgi:hypothetical protein
MQSLIAYQSPKRACKINFAPMPYDAPDRAGRGSSGVEDMSFVNRRRPREHAPKSIDESLAYAVVRYIGAVCWSDLIPVKQVAL